MARTWFITGAGRGLGAEIAKAVIKAGDRAVATGRSRKAIADALGPDDEQLLSVKLDVADTYQARRAVDAAVARFGAIDVLVNNAGYGHVGFFEELTTQDAQAQFATNLNGVLNVTWAVLPVMRRVRQGRIFNLSSLGGVIGAQLYSLYCASKFALEGFSESLAKEIAPFGLYVTIIEPGPFRTDFLKPESLRFGQTRISDYDDRRAQLRAGLAARNGRQPGDPSKLADAILHLANEAAPPMRFLAGSLALGAAEQKLSELRAELDRWRQLSASTDGDFRSVSTAGLMDQLR
jgi:NAD(P)-dependent dehydrogenase (short-subunit alcohol dehydrogenase family)